MNFPVSLKLRNAPRGSRRPPAPLRLEVRRGAAVGAANGLAWALMAGTPLWAVPLSACGCGAVGALVGLLLWSGSEAIPEEPVVPPSP